MRKFAIGDKEQGRYQKQNQNGWYSSHSTEDYHGYITRMERMVSQPDYPPFRNLHAIFKNENGLLVENDADEYGKNQNQNQNQNDQNQNRKGLEWQTHSADDYHAYITKMLRMPSVAYTDQK
ncbi:hypothetical protein NE237_017526 [Protea cynaroides]|uniref:Uncharacterized protein n=1 Tax=Protea cynaroides TaxID=273540 RepID=A0A9Q0K883_9MAGN|nr:hypothetical protein NE237_017526 [Protea cynaroides]